MANPRNPRTLSRRHLLTTAASATLLGALSRGAVELRHSPVVATDISQDVPSLRDAAKAAGFDIGILLEPFTFFQDPGWRDIVGPEFSSAAFGFSWRGNQPRPDVPPYYPTVQQHYDFVTLHGMDLLRVVLLTPRADRLPDWLVHGDYSLTELQNILYNFTAGFVSNCPYVSVWEIAELERQPYEQYDWFKFQFMKWNSSFDYVAFMCKTIKEVKPTALIRLSDYNNDTLNSDRDGDRSAVDRAILKSINANEVLIDLIGLQTHLRVDRLPKEEDIITAMQTYHREAGVGVDINELDFNLKDVQGSEDARLAAQAEAGRRLSRRRKILGCATRSR